MDEPRTRSERPDLRVLAGATVVLVLVTSAAWLGVGRHEPAIAGPEAVEALVAAWERYRSGTFVVESEWTRTMLDTGESDMVLTNAVSLAQRPPDRVLRQHGSIRGQLNGNPIYCSSAPDGDYGCRVADRPAPDHREEVQAELDAWRSYVAGAVPLYEITWDGRECFTLELVRLDYPDPPYGSAAELCFDADTGALRLLRRQLETATEVQRAVEIRTEVGPADLSLDRDEDNVLPDFATDEATGEPTPTTESQEGDDVPG